MNTVKHDFQDWKPVWQRDWALWKYEKEFYSYPAAKANHHAFVLAGLAYHTATMVRLADSVSISILSWIRAVSLRGLCYTTAKVIELRDLKTELFEATIGHIALIDDEEITKVLQELCKIDDQRKKKSSSFAMWSWVTMACSRIR